mmetsp:Transcript_35452/g.60761  ORF Transcript_35452/g.60761 Transcript_35452/m.60761 type:complete len:192 (-) Transcript_35452:235-810(-)
MGKKTKAPPKGATLLEGEELSKPLESALAASFLRFDLDGDGKWCVAELQAFAECTNKGEKLSEEEALQTINFFDGATKGGLTKKGFFKMMHMQSKARSAATWRDMKALGYDENLQPVPETPAVKAAVDLEAHLAAEAVKADALRSALAVVQSEPESAAAHEAVGEALSALGREDAAERSFSRAKELKAAAT